MGFRASRYGQKADGAQDVGAEGLRTLIFGRMGHLVQLVGVA